ncbi:MAG TPA: hypothetical protein VMY36_02305 [Patescibacteria group bacterium]|nr:hypothetical protein [Patescibacteria group bacterium]
MKKLTFIVAVGLLMTVIMSVLSVSVMAASQPEDGDCTEHRSGPWGPEARCRFDMEDEAPAGPWGPLN